MTGTVPPQVRKHLAVALEVEDTLVDAVVAATTRQQQDEARALILAREAAYKAAFKPHLRTENRPHNPGADLHRRPTRNSPVAARRGVQRGMERERR